MNLMATALRSIAAGYDERKRLLSVLLLPYTEIFECRKVAELRHP
jgi:hypothetical protein